MAEHTAPAAIVIKQTDNWHSIAALTQQDWQQQRHLSTQQAQQAAAFFQHPALQAIAVDLHGHKVDGF